MLTSALSALVNEAKEKKFALNNINMTLIFLINKENAKSQF
jgi:hypothetical protein